MSTPLPTKETPEPSDLRLTDPQIDLVVRRYTREMARYEEVATLIERRLRRVLRAHAIRALLSSRAKHPDDLRSKLKRKREDKDSEARYAYTELDQDLNRIVTDLAGCRVMVYRLADVEKVERLIKETFTLAAVPGAFEPHDKPSGYRATHALVVVRDDEERSSLHGSICEVQIASLPSHVFNELEHDIGYKDHELPPTEREGVELEDVRMTCRLLDRSVERLMVERTASIHRRTAKLKDGEDLRFTLEHAANRPLQGDFAFLFDLLNTAVLPLTAGTLADLGSVDELLARGKADAEDRLNIPEAETDDVIFIALALFDTYADSFEEFVIERGGPDTLLSKAVHNAAATRHVERGLLEVADRRAHQ